MAKADKTFVRGQRSLLYPGHLFLDDLPQELWNDKQVVERKQNQIKTVKRGINTFHQVGQHLDDKNKGKDGAHLYSGDTQHSGERRKPASPEMKDPKAD